MSFIRTPAVYRNDEVIAQESEASTQHLYSTAFQLAERFAEGFPQLTFYHAKSLGWAALCLMFWKKESQDQPITETLWVDYFNRFSAIEVPFIFNDDASAALPALIKANHIKALNLALIPYGLDYEVNFAMIGEYIAQATSLQELHLTSTPSDPKLIQDMFDHGLLLDPQPLDEFETNPILEGLKLNTSLKSIELDSAFSSVNFKTILAILLKNEKMPLSQLNLSRYNLTTQEIDILANFLKRKRSVTSLQLKDDLVIAPEKLAGIQETLRANQYFADKEQLFAWFFEKNGLHRDVGAYMYNRFFTPLDETNQLLKFAPTSLSPKR